MTPTKFSAKQASKEVGKATSTITSAIKSGKLSATKNENGSFEIDPSELFRVYPKKPNSKRPDPIIESSNDTRMLEQEVKHLKERLEDRNIALDEKNDVIEDLRTRLDKSDQDRRNLTMITNDNKIEAKKGYNLSPLLISVGILIIIFLGVIAYQVSI